jgi:hypothetical protein
MRKLLILAGCLLVASGAEAQTSTTNCTSYIPNNVQCTTNTTPGVNWGAFQQQQMQQQQQTQQQMNQAFSNLGAAIAAARERKREEKAAQAQAAAEAAREQQEAAAKAELDNELKAALAQEKDADPAPTDEKPTYLVCKLGSGSVDLALYEKHARVDETLNGVTRTRAAVFTSSTVTFNNPLVRASISRLDGSMTIVATIPALAGRSSTGSCAVATERKF